MKFTTLLVLTLTFLSFSAIAQRVIPSCLNPDVVLSPRYIPCNNVGPIRDFDLPDLNINFNDLKKILEETNQALLGAESGGGSGRVEPQRTPPADMQRQFPFSFKLNCTASLLIDAEKTIHYLLKQSFTLTNQNYKIFLTPGTWSSHYVTKEKSHSPVTKYSVPKDLGINLEAYTLTLAPLNKGLKSLLCQSTNIGKSGMDTNCSESRADIDSKNLFTGLLSSQKINRKKLKITKSLEITCTPES